MTIKLLTRQFFVAWRLKVKRPRFGLSANVNCQHEQRLYQHVLEPAEISKNLFVLFYYFTPSELYPSTTLPIIPPVRDVTVAVETLQLLIFYINQKEILNK